ncbi:MAG: UDP-N-acetylmuramoyl-L-alanyl-D-glutamate--2,6-diaminopimelate ligase [Stappiaceae bacterium]
MLLEEVALGVEIPERLPSTDITGITADSRKVRPGYIFAALKGAQADGRRFVPDAIAAGAVAVLTDADDPLARCSVPQLRASDPRRSLALMAAKLAGKQPDTIVAVTGTSGKTSVAVFVRQMFAYADFEAASLGTIGTVTSRGAHYGSLTTPDPVDLHRDLSFLAKDGVTHAALEASSHGLDQRRVDGVHLTAAGFTNLGRDHMDYHASVEEYLAAKMRLFDTLLPQNGTAVFDPDTPYADRVADICKKRGIATLTVGLNGQQLKLLSVEQQGFAQLLTMRVNGETRQVRLPLPGNFQVSNALLAAGLAIASGVEAQTALSALEHLEGAAGRLEQAGQTDEGALIFIDYAHKPDALDSALAALRPYAKGNLICIIGAGGDRDPGKRPLMGAAAARHADVVIVTDDNPRTENPEEIRKAVLEGAPAAIEIGDRGKAISHGVSLLKAGDILCVAGKGHEPGQIVGDQVLPFSDHEAVASILANGRPS